MKFGSTKPLKILVVEDDLVNRTLLKTLLAKSSLPISEVKSAESLNAALELLDKNHFDVVLSTLNLPDSKGLDTLVTISEKHPRAANVVITGQDGEDLGLRAIAMGAQEYLIKETINTDTLSKCIHYAIERKRTHEILDRKQKNLEAIFDAVPVGMLLVDDNMIVKRVNDAIRRMVRSEYLQIINQRVGGALGCTNSTYNGKGCGYSPACTTCQLRKTIESVLDSEQSVREVEIRPTLKVDDEEITPWLRISAEPAMIDGCKHVVIAVDDITERKRTEEKLKETMEIKSQFISMVSHELRTPLASMKEAVAIVLDGVAGKINEEQKNFLDIAKRNVDRLVLLINDVLDFQKLDAGRMRLNIQQNDIRIAVEEVYRIMAPSAKKKGIDLFFEGEHKLPKARFDRDKIIQVLTNLVSNAIKFTPERGRVHVLVHRQGEELVIRVNDTGIGIPKEDLPKIFDRFYRIERPGKQIQGTGLGLAIVKKIVMMHSGRIEVESELNKGTAFTVSLPLDTKSIPEVSPAKMDGFLESKLGNNEASTK